MKQTVWKLRSCGKCRGDLIREEDQWRCWQCGSYFYRQQRQPYPAQVAGQCANRQTALVGARPQRGDWSDGTQPGEPGSKRASQRQELRCGSRDREITGLLGYGYTPQEVAWLTGLSQQQVHQMASQPETFPAHREHRVLSLAAG